MTLAACALALGLLLQQLSCAWYRACLGVALEYRPSTGAFWVGVAAYGVGLWLGCLLGWVLVGRFRRGLAGRRRARWAVVALGALLGVVVGLLLVDGITTLRGRGIDLPPAWVGGDEGGPPKHIEVDLRGDEIPDDLEWWLLALIPWGLAVLGTWWAGRDRRLSAHRAGRLDA